jgi:serine/threonine protein kinase/Tol biopolymer transport system component
MVLTSGTKLGPYEILSPLGAGGMGEVYRARDPRLGRDVAVKVLPEAFANDAERMARFQREAQVLAALNHPNIASIYGLEESGGVRALVMELVEGPTLADRIAGAPLPLDETLHIAKQIVEALEAAHDKNIVHRDLKPANVKVTPEGAVKVLDFGLAKAAGEPTASGDPSNSPTLTGAATQAGMFVGTAAYMAPEQARGHAVDRRADIWSFGVVLFEMLSGQRAFTGETISDVLASVLKSEPDWSAIPAFTPPPLVRLLRRCLTKDRKRRLQAIGEARIAIDEYLADPAGAMASPAIPSSGLQQASTPSLSRLRFVWALVILLTIVAGGLAAWIYSHPRAVGPGKVLAYIPPPPDTSFRSYGFGAGPVVVSPDGSRLAFSATGQDGVTHIWVRPLRDAEASLVEGTEDGSEPFWSADGRSLGFYADDKLKTVGVANGSVQTLAEHICDRGGDWNRQGIILTTQGCGSGPIVMIPAAGGTPQPVTKLQGDEYFHEYPAFLPDGRHFLYTASYLNNGPSIMAGSLDSMEEKLILKGGTRPSFASGQLLYIVGGKIMAQAFNPTSLQLEGAPMPIAENTNFSVSENGVLAYQGGTNQARMGWFDRSGNLLGSIGDVASYYSVKISPDGKQVLDDMEDPKGGGTDLWAFPASGGVSTRLTFGTAEKHFAVWSPDGKYIAYAAKSGGTLSLLKKPADGSGQEEVLYAAGADFRSAALIDWSPDGRFLSYDGSNLKTGLWQNWVVPLFGDRKPFQPAPVNTSQYDGNFSPDGHWLAYFSYETGRPEVYVVPFPGPGGKFQISHSGGWVVRWGSKNQLFYATMGNRLEEADLEMSGNSLRVKSLRPLFEMNLPRVNDPLFDVTAGGQRFIVVTADRTTTNSITLVWNWTADLKK